MTCFPNHVQADGLEAARHRPHRGPSQQPGQLLTSAPSERSSGCRLGAGLCALRGADRTDFRCPDTFQSRSEDPGSRICPHPEKHGHLSGDTCSSRCGCEFRCAPAWPGTRLLWAVGRALEAGLPLAGPCGFPARLTNLPNGNVTAFPVPDHSPPG